VLRIRKPRRSNPPRRRGRADDESCVRLHPPGYDDVLVAICETVGLWRIKAYDVDLHGAVSASGDLDGFVEGLVAAAAELEDEHPALAASFVALATGDDTA
jgi:hypothetical protein